MSQDKDMLFSELLLEWLSSKELEIERTTFADYLRDVKYISDFFIGKKVIDITAKEIRRFYSSEINKGLTANTVKHRHVIIKPALTFAVEELKIIKFNPAMSVKLPKIRKFIPNIISPEIIKMILENEKDTPMEIPIFLAAIYGLRRSEVVGLKWKSIDFKNRIFTIENTLIRKKINGELQNIERKYGKTASSYRQFPILDEFLELLERIRENQEKYKKTVGNYTTKYNDYLCLNEKGELMRPEYLRTRFQKILKKYGLSHSRFHDLRHSCATFLYNLGVQMKDIQVWLGHASINTTMNVYTHLNHKNKKDTAERIKTIFINK